MEELTCAFRQYKPSKVERDADDEYRREMKQIFGNKTEMVANKEEAKEIFYSADSYMEYVLETFLKENFNKGISVRRHVDESIWIKKESISNMLGNLSKTLGVICTESRYILCVGEDLFIEFQSAGDDIDHFRVFSSSTETVQKALGIIKSYVCDEQKLSFRWIYSSDGRAIDIIEECDETVNASHYPFIANFDTFAERFINSKSNILILQGPPGTGKTTLIRHLMLTMDKQAYVTYDSRVLDNDHSFAQYMDDDSAGAFVIEDADLFLKSRAEGNGMVSRFLNIGDGLIKLKKKKLIFSTNLPNLNDIDSALIRPGRCFDIINFRALTRKEAEIIAAERKLELEEGKNQFTIAEIFNSDKITPQKQKFGFY